MRGRFERANAVCLEAWSSRGSCFEMKGQVRKALLQDLELADTKLRKIQEENEWVTRGRRDRL